jgi:hypothetical protein
MPRPSDLTPEELDRARELARVPDLLCVPIVAGILARCLLHTSGCTEEEEEERDEALSRARDVARLATGHPLWRTSAEQAQALVLRLVERDGTKLQPWNGGGLAYYALDFAAGAPETPAGYVERFRRWHALRQPSLLETVLLAIDCAGRVSPTPGVSMHLLGRAAKPLRLALIEPYQERLRGRWDRALAWSYSEYTLDSLSYFVLNLASTSTALGYKLNDVAALVRRACEERDQAIAARDALQEEEVERLAHARAEERVRQAEAAAAATEVARDRTADELRALTSDRDRVAARLAGALSRIESLEAQLTSREAESDIAIDPQPSPAAPPTDAAAPTAPAAPPTLAGEYVLVFTNQQRAGVREEIRSSFEALGAMLVEVIDVSRSHGPDTYPPDAVVVADITFMSHADCDAVKGRATRAGCRFVQLRGGSATLAVRTARWRAAGPPHD